MIEVAWWWHVAAVAVQAFAYWKAGDGWRHGWLLAAFSHNAWLGYALVTRQPLVALGGLTYALVAYRNSRKGRTKADVSGTD